MMAGLKNGGETMLSLGDIAIRRAAQDHKVSAQKDAQDKETGRIVLFPPRISFGKEKARRKAAVRGAEVEDLLKYERSGEPDDYPRRMLVNVIAFAFIVMLTLAGIWLAEQIALLRKHQDCALSGRNNCADIDARIRDR
jgi:hypothetical protein